MTKGGSHFSTSRFIMASAAALLLETPLATSILLPEYLAPKLQWSVALSCHVMACITLFFSMPKGLGWFYFQRKWPHLFFFLNLFFPVVGFFFALGLFLTYEKKERYDELFDNDQEFFAQFQPKVSPYLKRPSLWIKMIDEEIDFVPLVDILNGQDLDLKRGAIDKLAQIATPEAIETLLHFRSDPVPEVRFFITTALTKIRQNLEQELEAAHKNMKLQPNDHLTHIRLGRIYKKFALSHLLDPATKKKYLNEAIYHLNESKNQKPDEKSSYNLLIECYKEAENWPEILSLIEQKHSQSLSSNFEYHSQMASLAFDIKQDATFIEHMKKLGTEENLPKNWNVSVNWWGAKP